MWEGLAAAGWTSSPSPASSPVIAPIETLDPNRLMFSSLNSPFHYRLVALVEVVLLNVDDARLCVAGVPPPAAVIPKPPATV